MLSAQALQQTVDGLAVAPLARSVCWFPLHHTPAALQVLLQPYMIERERPSGWRWEAMPPSFCLPDGLVERLSQALTEALWWLAGERYRPDILAQLLAQWLDVEPVYPLAELLVLTPVTHGRAYETLQGILRKRGMTELDWDSATSLAIRGERYDYLTTRLQQYLVVT